MGIAMDLSSRRGKLTCAGYALLLASALTLAQSSSSSPNSPNKSPDRHSSSSRAGSSKAGSHHPSGKSTPIRSRRSRHSKKSASNWKRHGQQKIDKDRAREIQLALIREHYLDGQPSGVWDAATQKALEKYQVDNGWQSKTVPDSRALIKLGLGPKSDNLLNPETAMTGTIQTTGRSAHPPTPSTGAIPTTPVPTDLGKGNQPQN